MDNFKVNGQDFGNDPQSNC